MPLGILLGVPFRPLLGSIKRAIVPPHRVPAALEELLLFRFGFACYAAAEPPKGDALWARLSRGWGTTAFGELILVSHPETRVSLAEEDDRYTVLIGEAFFSHGAADRTPIGALSSAEGDALLDVLDRLSGRFAVIARRGGRTRIYHDAFGARTVFYRRVGAFAVASHPEIFAHAFGVPRWPEMMDFVGSQWFQSMPRAYLPTDATLFEGVYALLPNHAYDVERRVTERYWPRKPRQAGRTFDEFFGVFDDYFRGLATFVEDRRPIVAVTGGIDSRTLIAALRHYGVSFRTATWTTFNFAEWEREPIRQVVEYLNGDHSWVDHANDRINDTALIGARNSGNYRGPSPAVAGMARLFGKVPKAFWLPGIGAGMIRSTAEVEEFTADAILDYLLTKTDVHRFEHRAFVTREIEAMLDRGEFDQAVQLGYLPGNVFNWEHQGGVWAASSINAMQTAVDCMLGFNSRTVADVAMGLPEDVRCTKTLFHDVIRRYNPQLAAIHYQ